MNGKFDKKKSIALRSRDGGRREDKQAAATGDAGEDILPPIIGDPEGARVKYAYFPNDYYMQNIVLKFSSQK